MVDVDDGSNTAVRDDDDDDDGDDQTGRSECWRDRPVLVSSRSVIGNPCRRRHGDRLGAEVGHKDRTRPVNGCSFEVKLRCVDFPATTVP